MTDFTNRLALGGKLLLQALQDVADKRLGVNSQLSTSLRAARAQGGETEIAGVQRSLAGLPEKTQEELLREVHHKMAISGPGLLAAWPVATPQGGGKSTKH